MERKPRNITTLFQTYFSSSGELQRFWSQKNICLTEALKTFKSKKKMIFDPNCDHASLIYRLWNNQSFHRFWTLESQEPFPGIWKLKDPRQHPGSFDGPHRNENINLTFIIFLVMHTLSEKQIIIAALLVYAMYTCTRLCIHVQD